MKTVVLLLTLLAVGVVSGQQGRGLDYAAVRESLLVVPPKMHSQWLKERGFELPGLTEYRKPETTGLRLVGKWGRGRAWDVTGQDSLVFLSLGSQVAILNFADPASPELITELQLDYLALQARVRDSLLVTGRNGIDLWSIADPARPRHLSHIPCFVSDFDVVDTFLYFVRTDTFNVYNIARPDDPVRLGFCRDSGYVVTATRNTAVLLTRDFLTFMDVSDPSAPRRVGTYGGWPLAAVARGSLLCATFSNPSRPEESWFDAVDISDPANARRLARLNNTCGMDVHLEGPYAFVTGRGGYEPMQILDIADSTRPAVLGELVLPGNGIWSNTALDRAWVACDWGGFRVIDISNPVAPVLDTVLLRADMAEDVYVDGSRAYVANYRLSLKILDISDPARPVELGGVDSAGATSEAVVAKDSFAYIGWRPRPYFRVFDVSDPSRPVLAGTSTVESRAMDMVLRDTLVYFAANQWFRVINIARPREPEVVGSCALPGASGRMDLQGAIAYVTNTLFSIVSVGLAPVC
ncbi:MAG: hypothetical protein R6X12_04785 [bacterium]